MSISDRLEQQLQERFGLSTFRQGQRDVIDRLLAGKSVAAIFPTGGGKSLCYQLPALLLDGLTLVVSPLMALMREQVLYLQSRGIPAVRMDSSLTPDELRTATASIRNGQAKLLYVAPERFFNERFRELISRIPIDLMAVDEAHCISQWGHNFRPDYLKLSGIAGGLAIPRVLALTATATPEVVDDIRLGFDIDREDVVQTPFHRENLTLRFTLADPKSRKHSLVKRLNAMPRGTTIVYVTLQKTAVEVATLLAEEGFPAQAYHAGLDDDTRQQVQDWFMQAEEAIVVATIAFGMGIDKPNIRYVFHWNVSKGLESYAQEVGRAGRDGLPSHCETFLVPEDRVVLENFAYGDTPTVESVERLVDFIAHQPPEFHLSYYAISNEFDIRDLVVRTLITYLELDGYLESIGPRYDSYHFKPLVPSSTILKNFSGEEQKFVSHLLALSVKKKIWFSIPIAAASQRLGCDRRKVVAVLDDCAEQGWLELKVADLVHGYRKRKSLDHSATISQQLVDRVCQLEHQELKRIDRMMELAIDKFCQAMRLSAYFGQPMSHPCERCSACLGESIDLLPPFETGRIGTSAMTGLATLIKQHPEVLAPPRNRAKFLCGITSPAFVRSRLTRDPFFGCCSNLSFADVLKAVSSTALVTRANMS